MREERQPTFGRLPQAGMKSNLQGGLSSDTSRRATEVVTSSKLAGNKKKPTDKKTRSTITTTIKKQSNQVKIDMPQSCKNSNMRKQLGGDTDFLLSKEQ